MRSVFSPYASTQGSVINLNSDEFEQKIKEDNNAVLIDVRTDMEHREVRIPNSELFDIYHPAFRSKIEMLDKTKNYYLYCRSGNRSYHAAQIMKQMGFDQVYNLSSGIIGWYGPVESD